MKNKGFTLIELLGVIVLLAIIASIAFPAVQSSLNKAKEKTLKENIRVIVEAGKRFIVDSENDDEYSELLNKLRAEEDENKDALKNTCLTINFLKSKGYLTSNQKLVDPTKDNKELTGLVLVTYDYDNKDTADDETSTDEDGNYNKRFIYKYIESKEDCANTLDSTPTAKTDSKDDGGSCMSIRNTLKSKIVTSGDGLYSDSTISGRYVYKGTNPSNYITLGSDTYRILALESDGTLKVTSNSKVTNMSYDDYQARYSKNSSDYCYNDYTCNCWGSKTSVYDSTGKSTTKMSKQVGGTALNLPTEEATLNTYLNSTWLKSLPTKVQNKIVTHYFNVAPLEPYDYQSSISDTVTLESTYKWKGKVGLKTVSDYLKANSNTDKCGTSGLNSSNSTTCKETNWLSSLISFPQWTMTPYSGATMVIGLTYDGGFSGITSYHGYDVVPVFFLSSKITLSGTGTQSDPYKIC